jgi:hypothetical protein
MLRAARQQLGSEYEAHCKAGRALPLPDAMAAAEAVRTTMMRNALTAPL